MANLASPVIHPFRWASSGATAAVAAHRLLPLLKVRTIHAVLVTLLVVTQYWLELASSLSQQPRLLVETFVAMFERNVVYWIVGFAVFAIVQTGIAAGRMRTIALLSSSLLWSALWSVILEMLGSFLVVDLGLTTHAGLVADSYWTNTTYMLLAAWCYDSADRATRSTSARRQSELARTIASPLKMIWSGCSNTPIARAWAPAEPGCITIRDTSISS